MATSEYAVILPQTSQTDKHMHMLCGDHMLHPRLISKRKRKYIPAVSLEEVCGDMVVFMLLISSAMKRPHS